MLSDAPDLALLMTAVTALPADADAKALEALLQDLVRARLDPLGERQVLAALKLRTRVSLSVLGEALRHLRGEARRAADGGRPSWIGKLILSEFGEPRSNLANAITALRHAPEWQGVLGFDEFRAGACLIGHPPWGGFTAIREWTETDDRLSTEWLQRAGIDVRSDTVSQAVETVARETSFHPVRDYLSSIAWDGQPRLERWLIDHLSVDDTAYARAVGTRWMIAAVARIFQPGCKADCALILEGAQGIRKSTALRTLAEPWFTDELADLGSRDAAMQTRGAWVIELAELDAVSRAEVSRIKAFMSRTTDRFRPPYGRRLVESPRSCVFAGSVNDDAYLRDASGGRRFWPVRCGEIDVGALVAARDQLWAEAVVRFRAGEPWWLDDRDLIDAAAVEQSARLQRDAWEERIRDWCETETVTDDHGYGPPTVRRIPRRDPIRDTTMSELLGAALGIEVGRWNRGDQQRVAAILTAAGWSRYQRREGERREWRWRQDPMTT